MTTKDLAERIAYVVLVQAYEDAILAQAYEDGRACQPEHAARYRMAVLQELRRTGHWFCRLVQEPAGTRCEMMEQQDLCESQGDR